MSTPYFQQPAGAARSSRARPRSPRRRELPRWECPYSLRCRGRTRDPGAAPYQGYPQAYAVGPYAQLPPRVNKLSVGLGIAGWVIIGLTVLLMWLSILATESDPDPSGKEVIGFYPLFASIFLIPVNLVGGITGLVRAGDKMTKWKLNWLGNHPEREPACHLLRRHARVAADSVVAFEENAEAPPHEAIITAA